MAGDDTIGRGEFDTRMRAVTDEFRTWKRDVWEAWVRDVYQPNHEDVKTDLAKTITVVNHIDSISQRFESSTNAAHDLVNNVWVRALAIGTLFVGLLGATTSIGSLVWVILHQVPK